MDNVKYRTHEIKKICENKLQINFRDSKEFNGWFMLGDIKVARITVPKGKKEIPKATYSSMARQLLLNVQQFDELLACDIEREGYEKIVSELS